MVNFRQLLEQKKGQFKQVNLNHHNACQSLYILQEQQVDLEKAQFVIQEVALLTQNQLKYHVSEIATLALASVFDNPYEVELEFIQRRNQTECDIYFVRDGERVDPLSASGVGYVDVAAFGLRVALWSLQKPRTRPIFILDEPMKHIKGDSDNIKAIQMIKEVSKRLGLQILMVSDERIPLQEIEAGADRVFHVALKRKVSKVTTL